MKVLYVSDLDGTLLHSDAKISDYTNQVINQLTSEGMLFSYATARSYLTATKVTKGLHAKIPIITYNGAVILQNNTFEILAKNTFSKEEKEEILNELLCHGIYPIVYSYISGKEKFSYLVNKCNRATYEFLLTRKGDIRDTPVESDNRLGCGDVFYFTCIDKYEKLEPLYIRLKEKYHCIFQKDIYSGEQWLEIIPKTVSKANAILQLKEYLGAEYIVAFGDGKNDIEMFEIADESYAVENAVDELKALATGIIENNDSDGVAKWLYRLHCRKG
ncbi:MAG: HAD family hydrolase [Lachnospiraceae bacterium]|nr:HAD family hydrolase [Lachnospiraceae bacterium]